VLPPTTTPPWEVFTAAGKRNFSTSCQGNRNFWRRRDGV